jgi:hypothetical protein
VFFGVSSCIGSFRPSHEAAEAAIGALQLVPVAQQPVRAMAAKTLARDFDIISVPQ